MLEHTTNSNAPLAVTIFTADYFCAKSYLSFLRLLVNEAAFVFDFYVKDTLDEMMFRRMEKSRPFADEKKCSDIRSI